jgi:hypothetical protein
MASIPPLLGKRETAEILGVHPNNLKRDVKDLPPSLQERNPAHAVKATPLWRRGEIEALARRRARTR